MYVSPPWNRRTSSLTRYDTKDGIGLPEELGAFLHEKNSTGARVRNFPNIRIALGPYNKSWWASDGSTSRWMNLPKGLEGALRDKRSNGGTGPFTDAPRFIALGTDGNYFMVTEKNAANWCLADYRELQTIIEGCKDTEAGVSNIKSLVLHPYRLQTWVIQTTSGLVVSSNLPPHMEEHFNSIKAAVQEDTLARTALLAGVEKQKALQADYQRRKAAEQAVAMKLGQTINVMAAITLGLIMGSSGLNGN
jgi:hypothetical protein